MVEECNMRKADNSDVAVIIAGVAEWLGSGPQPVLHWFESGPQLQSHSLLFETKRARR